MMTPNYFTKLLENELFQDEKKKSKEDIKTNEYVPKDSTLDKLTVDNPQLIALINMINPFQKTIEYEVSLWRNIDKEIKKFFPLSSNMISKLGDRGRKVVIERWTEGIKSNIKQNKDKLVSNDFKAITTEELLYVFVDEIVKFTSGVVFKQSTISSGTVLRICLRATELTSNINQDAKNIVKNYYEDLLKFKKFDDSNIVQYKNSKYKFLDINVETALKSTDYIFTTSILSNIESYLQFIDIPIERIVNESKEIFDRLIIELEDSKKVLDETLLLKNTPEYKSGTYSVVQEVRKAESRYRIKRGRIKVALEAMAKI